MMAPALTFRDVTVRYELGAAPAIRNISFSLAPGERAALVGLNGSGKTTVLLSAAGLVPHTGEIQVGGITVARRTLPAIRDRIGFLFNVPENQLLFPKVIEDVAFGLLRRGTAPGEASAQARRVLEALGVADLAESPVHHLSHGQKQRVALAGALITGPRVLLLDEPSAGLDPPGRRNLGGLLGEFDAAMLVATHDFDFAARFCERFIMLAQGQIVLDSRVAADVLRRWEPNDSGTAMNQADRRSPAPSP